MFSSKTNQSIVLFSCFLTIISHDLSKLLILYYQSCDYATNAHFCNNSAQSGALTQEKSLKMKIYHQEWIPWPLFGTVSCITLTGTTKIFVFVVIRYSNMAATAILNILLLSQMRKKIIMRNIVWQVLNKYQWSKIALIEMYDALWDRFWTKWRFWTIWAFSHIFA